MAKEKWDRNREEIQELVQQEKMIFEGAFLNVTKFSLEIYKTSMLTVC